MTIRPMLATALALMIGTVPAMASNGQTPPGNPCGKGNGNPCNGNAGNDGDQGNANKEKIKYRTPGAINIAVAPVSGRAAYITQIGEAQTARVTQTAPNAYAQIDQHGQRNDATVMQGGTGTGYVRLAQTGAHNIASATQGGNGQNVVFLAQDGVSNRATSVQTALGAVYNGAIIDQQGTGNAVSLTQDGGDNRANLSQQGDGNAMTAVQQGDANRLVWSQTGDNLSNLGITQSGNQAIMITQSGIGK